jgi:hypothetical protein
MLTHNQPRALASNYQTTWCHIPEELVIYFIYGLFYRQPGQRSQCNDGLRVGWPEFDSRKGQDFSLLHSVQNGSQAHPASYQMGTGDFSPGGQSSRGVKLTTHLHLVPMPRMVEL